MRTRRNPDFDTELRRLERAASLGDPAALERLMAMRARLAGGDPRPAVLALMKVANKGARADIARINERQVGTVLRLITGIPELGIFPQLAAWSWLSRRKRLVFASRCGTEGEVLLGMTSCLGGSGEASHTNSDFWSPWFLQTPAAIAMPRFRAPSWTLPGRTVTEAHAEGERYIEGRQSYVRRQHQQWGQSFPNRHEGDRIDALTDTSALAGRSPRFDDEFSRRAPREPGEPLDAYWARRDAAYDAYLAQHPGPAMPRGEWRYHRTFFVPTPEDSRFERRLGEWCAFARAGEFSRIRGSGVVALTEPQATFLAEVWR